MNILLINHYAGTPKLGMEYRPFYFAKNWVKSGHKVTVIAASFSHLRIKNPHIRDDFEEHEVDGINYCWIKTPPYSEELSGRGRNTVTFVYKLWRSSARIAEKYAPDVVIASSTYPFDIYAAARIAKFSSAPLVWEVHDLWPLTQTALYHYSEKNPLVISIEKAQRYALKNADKIVSIIPKADEYLEQYGLDKTKYIHIPNGTRIEKTATTPPKTYLEMIANSKQRGRFVVMYCGSVGTSNALSQLIASAPLLKDKADIYIVGNGGFRIVLKRIVKQGKLQNVFLLDAIPSDEVRELMKKADCLYLGATDCALYKYGVGMNKLFEYMNSGRPVLFAVDCGYDPVEKSGCGISLGGCTPDKIAEGVLQMIEMPRVKLDDMGKKGIEYVKNNHDYTKLSDVFLNVLKELADK